MSEYYKTYVVIDKDGDVTAKDLLSKAEAVEVARQKVANGGGYAPYAVYEAVAIVTKATPPTTVIDL